MSAVLEHPFVVAPVAPAYCPADLTLRQSGVAACLLDGMTDREAAAALRLDVFTVAAVVRRLCERCEAYSRAHLVRRLAQMLTMETA